MIPLPVQFRTASPFGGARPGSPSASSASRRPSLSIQTCLPLDIPVLVVGGNDYSRGRTSSGTVPRLAGTRPPAPANSPLPLTVPVPTRDPAFRHYAPTARSTSTDSDKTRAPSPETLPVVYSQEMLAVGELLSGMRATISMLGSTLDVLGVQAATVARLQPSLDLHAEIDSMRALFDAQLVAQATRMHQLETYLKDLLFEKVTESLKAHIANKARSLIAQQVEDRLEKDIPASIRAQVQLHKREILEVKTELFNCESRRHNAVICTPPQSLDAPLRPLLRPLATPLQSPAVNAFPARPFATMSRAPNTPAPTPVSKTFSLEPSTPSRLFPRNLASLYTMGPPLVKEYGLLGVLEEEEEPIPVPPGNMASALDVEMFLEHTGGAS